MKTLSSFSRFVQSVCPHIQLQKHQKELFSMFEKKNSLLISKYRQGGFTTLAYLYLLWKVSSTSNFRGMLIVDNYCQLKSLEKTISPILGREFTKVFLCGNFYAGTDKNSGFIITTNSFARMTGVSAHTIILDELNEDRGIVPHVLTKKMFCFLPPHNINYNLPDTIQFTKKISKNRQVYYTVTKNNTR